LRIFRSSWTEFELSAVSDAGYIFAATMGGSNHFLFSRNSRKRHHGHLSRLAHSLSGSSAVAAALMRDRESGVIPNSTSSARFS
jgi:hypothetical protein